MLEQVVGAELLAKGRGYTEGRVKPFPQELQLAMHRGAQAWMDDHTLLGARPRLEQLALEATRDLQAGASVRQLVSHYMGGAEWELMDFAEVVRALGGNPKECVRRAHAARHNAQGRP